MFRSEDFEPLGRLARHPGYARVIQQGHLTLGFIAPLESYPDRPGPTMADHAEMAKKRLTRLVFLQSGCGMSRSMILISGM